MQSTDTTASTAATPPTRLCRFEPGLCDISVHYSEVYETSLFELEDLWEDCLYGDEGDNSFSNSNLNNNNLNSSSQHSHSRLSNGNALGKPSLFYVPRTDAAWLHCRKPHTLPLDSVFGILEESSARDDDDDDHSAYATKVTCYQGSLPSDIPETLTRTSPCSCPYPHENWKRWDWNHPSPMFNYNSQSDARQPPKTLQMDLIDLRSCTTDPNWLPTQAARVHFFRSLLRCAHSESPWVPFTPPDHRQVVMLLVSHASDDLIRFRVSDACPSWYLHSVANVQLHANSLPWKQAKQHDWTMSTLLVYRPLAPRMKLSPTAPIALTASLKSDITETDNGWAQPGCLWETVVIQDKDVENADGPDPPLPQFQYRMVAPPFIDGFVEYPYLLEPLLTQKCQDAMIQEAMNIQHWTAWPESQHYSHDPDKPPSWNVFPLCHCFPANQVENKKWIPATCAQVPRTVALLKKHLGNTLRTALFSRLDAQSTLEAHTGWNDLANHVYRLHIPLVVPAGNLCGVWVDGCVETHRMGSVFLLDDSKIHRAFNYSTQDRIVLILDLARPSSLPVGTATGGHSEELDQFIEQMGKSRIEL
jgi:hypothetical protein